IANFSQVQALETASSLFSPESLLYNVIFVGLIIFFCFFYTAIIFDPKDIAENLKKQGGFIPGIRPGKQTYLYIDKVLTRITFWGSLYVSAICVLPMILITQLNIPFYFGGTALLIVVGVAIDTMSRVQSYLISHQYEGLMQKSKLKGRF
ncbi:MAG: preprotein translocase subunit SecY, partial [Desulfohalobiaceae bacterium]